MNQRTRAKAEEQKAPERTVGELYLHVGNSGVTFKVIDTGFGPEVEVTSGAFGNLESRFRVKTNQDALRSLRDLFDAALKESYSKEYCHSAQSLEWRDTLWAQREKCWDAETKEVVKQMCEGESP